MTDPKIIKSYREEIARAITRRRVGGALSALTGLAAAAGVKADMRDSAARLAADYELLKEYALNGVDDPQRETVMNGIMGRITALADSMVRFSEKESSPKLYFSTLRYEEPQPDGGIVRLCKEYQKLCSEMGLALLGGVKQAGMAEKREALSTRLFKVIWVTHPLDAEQQSAIEELISNDATDSAMKELALSAVMLGAIEYFDERRLLILGRTYQSMQADELGVIALCGLLLSLWVNRESVSTPHIEAMMASLAELPGWKSDVRMMFMQFLRARDTERITRKVNEEFIPGMMKIRPDIERKMREMAEDGEVDPEAMEANPEWEDMLRKSGLEDMMKELSELQAEGSDVMMSTFAGLKGFAFFNEIANWFRPFSSEVTEVARMGVSEALLAAIESGAALCDSDKYSIVFSLSQVPEAQRRMMLEQFKAYGVNEAELQSAALNGEARNREAVASNYVRNLYRFFKLFRRKGEFRDPFAKPVNLPSLEMLRDAVGDDETLNLVAEFYFTRGYHSDALELYNLMMDRGVNDWQVYQKAGFCLQKLGRTEEALEMYERSELINAESVWTLRRIAQCLRKLGRYDEALSYFRRVEKQQPDDLNVTMAIGHCLLESGKPDEALKAYFKVEFLCPDSPKAMRPIAGCAMLTGDLERAHHYYGMLLGAENPSAGDLLNAGHLALLERRYRDAVDFYRRSLSAHKMEKDEFERIISTDLGKLLSQLPDELIINIVLEEI